jgi:hypothetical protein
MPPSHFQERHSKAGNFSYSPPSRSHKFIRLSRIRDWSSKDLIWHWHNAFLPNLSLISSARRLLRPMQSILALFLPDSAFHTWLPYDTDVPYLLWTTPLRHCVSPAHPQFHSETMNADRLAQWLLISSCTEQDYRTGSKMLDNKTM